MSQNACVCRNPFLTPLSIFSLIITLIVLQLTLSATRAGAAQLSLSWQAPATYTDGTPLTNLAGYKLYAGTSSGNYSQNIDVGNTTSYTMSGLDDGTKYYFAVMAYDTAGIVSPYSNEVAGTTPAPPPTAALYTLTASAGSGGTISPSGAVVLSEGASQTFAITPNSGYAIASVTVDGVSAGKVASYTFSNVTANHTIAATFSVTTVASYSISANAGTGGSISPSGTATVTSGGSQTYTIAPAAGYQIAGVTVDGVSAGAVSSYTFSNVTANHTIAATFTASLGTTYAISASAGFGGSISPSGTIKVAAGGSQTFTITPKSGYKITAVKVDGVSVGAAASYTFSNVTAKHRITATFALGGTYATIPHTAWTLQYVDSQELAAENGAATNAFDGSNGTLWHTEWSAASPAGPHEIQINLGKSYSLNSFSYLPRQDGDVNGTIARYEFYVSGDGVNWGTPVAAGTFASDTTLKTVSFTAKTGQYIRLRALSEINGQPWTSAAEINVTGK